MNQEQNANYILSDMEWKQASESLENILACATKYLSNSRSDEQKARLRRRKVSRHRNTRKRYSNNTRHLGLINRSVAHQLKTKQRSKEDRKSRQGSKQDQKTNHGVTVEVLENSSNDIINGLKGTVDPIMIVETETGFRAAQMESWALQEDIKNRGSKNVSNSKAMHTTKAETPKKRFRCVKCDVLFGRKANLEQHYRIHTDERPYHCNQCSKTFRQKCHLDQHTKVHTGERPYECTLCNKAFKQKGQLYNHNKTVGHIQKAAEAACGNTEDVVVVMPSPE